jgi:hypothetical protein
VTSTRTHLKEMHTAHADFHVRAAASHAKLAKCFGKMDVEGADDVGSAHQELAAAHAAAAAHSVQCAKALDASSKAMGMGDDDVMPMPAGLSSVYKMDNLRAVPRTGSPELGATSVDPALHKFIAIEDGDD